MRNKLIFICVAFFWATNASLGQQAPDREKRRYVVFPPQNVLVAVASQPDCPLELYEPRFYYDIDAKRLAATYRIRNRGTKPLHIKSYTIAAQYLEGGGWTSGALGSLDPLPPGQSFISNDHYEEVALTDDLRDKLDLRRGMRQAVVLMIESIEYTDGSRYDGKWLSEALRQYFANAGTAPPQRK